MDNRSEVLRLNNLQEGASTRIMSGVVGQGKRLSDERAKCAHLLRRFGFGASEAELDYYLEGTGLAGAIDKLLDYDNVDEGFDAHISKFQNNNGNIQMPAVQAWWVLRLISTRRPLQEKMTLFWHDHFATSAQKVTAAPMMYQQNELLRRNATGKFQTLLLESSQDPAMLFWLDNQFNVKGKANENFAREVMELFTLGIGHYTENDVQEAARSFTGWSIRRLPRPKNITAEDEYKSADFLLRRALHDNGEKNVLGTRGPLGGEDVIEVLCKHPQTALNLVTKIWEWFAYPKPEKAVVERLALSFRASDLDIKALLRAVMESPEFYSEKAYRSIYKNPVDFVVPTVRQLGVGEGLMTRIKEGANQGVVRAGGVAAAQQSMKGMGMDLFFPPDVNGWMSGSEWISSATMVERIGWADRLFGVAAPAARRAQVRFNANFLFVDDPTPAGVVAKLLSVFDAEIPEGKRGGLVAAVEKVGTRITPQNANQAAAAASRLIFGSPEFQFC